MTTRNVRCANKFSMLTNNALNYAVRHSLVRIDKRSIFRKGFSAVLAAITPIFIDILERRIWDPRQDLFTVSINICMR